MTEVERWIKRVEHSIAQPGSMVDERVLKMSGFGSQKVLHVLNNICSWQCTRYVEFGSWAGRSLAAAATSNTGSFLGVENFSGLIPTLNYKVRPTIQRELAENLQPLPQARVLSMDFHDFKLVDGSTIDVFFYDADHSRKATGDGITIAARYLRCGVLIVDDIELRGFQDQVMPGLLDGLLAGDITLHREWVLKKANGYHEGLWIGVVEGQIATALGDAIHRELADDRERERATIESFTKAWTG